MESESASKVAGKPLEISIKLRALLSISPGLWRMLVEPGPHLRYQTGPTPWVGWLRRSGLDTGPPSTASCLQVPRGPATSRQRPL